MKMPFAGDSPRSDDAGISHLCLSLLGQKRSCCGVSRLRRPVRGAWVSVFNFDDPAINDRLAANQFSFVKNRLNRHHDVALFISVIPLMGLRRKEELPRIPKMIYLCDGLTVLMLISVTRNLTESCILAPFSTYYCQFSPLSNSG